MENTLHNPIQSTTPADPFADAKCRLLEVLEKGLVKGVGNPEPGQFCAEAAVCYVLGEPHSDRPSCVHEVDRVVVIKINDSYPGTEHERAIALRPVLLAHLGTAGKDRSAWLQALVRGTIQVILPLALNAAADIHPDAAHQTKLRESAAQCAEQGTQEAADAAYAAAASAATYAYAANAAADAAYAAAYAYAAASAATYAYAANAAADAAYAAAYAYAAAAYATQARRQVWDKFIEVVLAAYAQEGAI